MQRTAHCTWTVFAAAFVGLLIVLLTASEARTAPSLITDNSTDGRFTASSKWIQASFNPDRYGEDYRALKRPSAEARSAQWKVAVPDAGNYDVYARWPSDPGYTQRATYKIPTTSGVQTKTVNQQKNGGKWMKLGEYKLADGDVKILLSSKSTSKGFIIADAVRIAKPGATLDASADGGSGGVTGADIVREAERHLGKDYVYGADGPSSFDCSGLTQYVYKQAANKDLPHSAAGQYDYGRSVSKSELKAGDLIFGNAGGSGIQHVGIYDGKGGMIHAGTSQTDVERTPFQNTWYNVIGYKRLV